MRDLDDISTLGYLGDFIITAVLINKVLSKGVSKADARENILHKNDELTKHT